MTTHTTLRSLGGSQVRLTVALIAAMILTSPGPRENDVVQARSRTGCAAAANPIACENAILPGDTDWDIAGAGAASIQGFADGFSFDLGATVDFKIQTDSSNYRIDIYRLGYYAGAGARKVATMMRTTAQTQPACATDGATGLYDCGNWTPSASWTIPDNTVSGVHIAKLTRLDATPGTSHIVFVVRDDTRPADVLFQTSDTTWQAYNRYGGASTYCVNDPNDFPGPLSSIGLSNAGTAYPCARRAAKVSYNRPFDTRDHDPQSFLFNAEYPMVRFLEANGYNTKYWSGVDTDRFGADLTFGLTSPNKPKIFLSVGHDEYWSGAQRTRVENARNAGVNLAFMSGNEVYWKHRWEGGHRTLVVYKETLAGQKIDPEPNIWTGTWRDPRFSPPADGGRPENALIGSIWTVNCCSHSITVPASMAGLRFWRNTRVAQVTTGSETLGNETLGYEWGEALENGFQPAGLVRLSSTTQPNQEKILDFGATVGPGTATHSLTLYRHNSGALVFGASSVQWSWGLDAQHDRGTANAPDQAMQQATVNLFADMGNVQPLTLQAGADPTRPLVTAIQTTDIFAPTSAITSPAAGTTVESGSQVTITGTATESGGGQVAAVEVSVDGGATWRAAQGKSAWTFAWSPGALGAVTIKTRATDDTGNLEMAGPGITVTVGAGVCPCPSLWRPSTVPESTQGFDSNGVPTTGFSDFPDNGAYELGVKVRSDIDGFINGIRYFKSAANSGTHLGNLWTAGGQLLATATFVNEGVSGWQQVLFDSPVPITANTIYVASYHTNVGHYAVTQGFLLTAGINSPPLHAPPTTEVGGNGVFSSGGSAFPSQTFNGNYYWVDVVFAPTNVDGTAPVISNVRQQAIDSSKIDISWTTDEIATSRVDYSTNPVFPPASTLSVSNSDFKTSHRLTIPGLAANTTYHFSVISVDKSGNAATFNAPSFTLPGPTLRDTAEADFSAGMGANVYVSGTGNGELTLRPTIGAEFSGTTLPADWKVVPWEAGGFAQVSNGKVKVDGARVGTCVGTSPCVEQAPYGPGRSLEFVATFTGDAFQHAGLAVDFTSTAQPWAIFSTLTGGNLHARTNNGQGVFDDFFLGGTYLGGAHRYRIDWNANGTVSYFVDGTLVHSPALVVGGQMRPIAASDFSVFGGAILVDWVHLTPYAAAGAFESRIFDAQSTVVWNSILWTAVKPAGTTLDISVRTGNTPTPDPTTWSAFNPVAAPGVLNVPQGQYIQYRADMTSPNPALTPSLEDIIISTGQAPVAMNDSFNVAQNRSRTFPVSGPGSLTFNDTDGDTVNDALRVVAVTAPSHGTAVLNADGSLIYTPTLNYNGPDAFSYTVSDGLLTSSAVVSITVTFTNQAPEANGDFYTVNEDTPLSVSAQLGLLRNDVDVEGDALRAVLVSPPAFGTLALSPTGAFSYTPALNFAGPVTFTYMANDGDKDSNVATVQILINQVNDPPFTMADAYTALLNQPLVVAAPGVLANDRDVEVEDTNPLRAQLTSGPTNGVLSFSNTGSFTYTPNADFLGIDTFKYRSVDHFDAVSLTEATVTITVALKAVSQSVASGATVATGTGVSAGDPLQSAVTTPTPATVSIAQGVISGSQSPTGYTFLNQQVNITVLDATGTAVTATAANPLVFTFEIDLSLIPAGQTEQTFEIFRNGVLVPNCLGATTIPAANLDPCVSRRENGTKVKLTILTTQASKWNMGLPAASLGAALVAFNDGPFWTNFETPLVQTAPGVLGNDFGPATITAALSGTPEGGTVALAPSGAFTFTPNAGSCGPASFKYKAQDGVMPSNEATVSIMVNCKPLAVTDSPTVFEDSGANAITVLSNDSDPDPGQTLKVIAVTQGANGTVAIAGAGMWVTYQPNANFFGNDSFTYTVQDTRGGTAIGTVNVTVTNVNDAPSFTKGADQTVLEDAVAQTVAGWATGLNAGPNESGQLLDFLVTNDNNTLFLAQPAVASNGTLTFTPAPHANGMATVTVRLHDNGGVDGGSDTSAPQMFTIAVTAVNDAPSFTKGANESLSEDFGTRTVAGWATQISAGPPDEAGQTLTFTVSNDNPALFSAPPAIAANGTLTYDPAPNANGVANVTVTLKDNGGTANSGIDTSGPQMFTITLYLVNDAPTFTKGATQTVLEDAAAQSVAGWATGISAGPSDEAGQVLNFMVSNDNTSLFSSQPAIAANGTLSFTPAPNANGMATVTVQLHDDGGILNGGSDTSAAQMFTIAVTAVNDAPSFTNAGNQAVLGNAGAQTVANWATGISVGPSNEAGQTPSFVVTNDNNGLFSAAPVVSSNGTLSYTPTANMTGTAVVTVVLQDDGGTANGGVAASAAQVFTISIAKASTLTIVSTSNTPSLFGVPITLTANVSVVAPGLGAPTGTVTFKRGTTTIGTAGVIGGVATLNTSTLPVGTHSITATYGGATTYAASTSTAITQVIDPSGTLNVTFTIHAIQDNTQRPRVTAVPVAGALVRVFTRKDVCTNGVVVTPRPKMWGIIFDGLDGPGGTDQGCPVVTVGNYRAEGVTNASGQVSIIVPPTANTATEDYVVIGRTDGFDYVATATDPDTLYAAALVRNVVQNTIKKVKLHQIRTFAGKKVPGKALEEYGSYLAVVQPEYINWTENQEQYPVVLVAEGGWDVTTSIAPPEGFLPDATAVTATVADTTTAVQFTLTDVASEWTETSFNHNILHQGGTRLRTDTVPMYDKKVTLARADARKVMHDSTATIVDVMTNDRVAHYNAPIRITSFTSAMNGNAAFDPDGFFRYTPNPGFSGTDTFTYTITDAVGTSSTGTVTMTVLATPEVSVVNGSGIEGNDGMSAMTFTVKLSNQSLETVTVNYQTVDGTAQAGADYVATSGSLTFAPLVTTMPVTVQFIGDTLAEFHEKFNIRVSGPTNATIAANPAGDITITDDDPPEVTIAATASITEANAGTTNVTIPITLSQPHDISVWVSYVTVPGTALSGSDYWHRTGTVQFYPGTVTQTINIAVVGDTVGEVKEHFYVDLNTPLNSTLTAASRTTVTVVNDDSSTWVTSTTADFGAGTLEGGAFITQTANGELQLKPTDGDEFFGPSLPAGWTSTELATGGTSIVANGAVAVDGAALRSPTGYAGVRTLEFNATFSGAPEQSIGFGDATAPVSPMAMFIVKADRQLYARLVNGAGWDEGPMAGVNWLGKALTYRIVLTSSGAQYFVNGTLMTTLTGVVWGTVAMRPVIIDTFVGGGAVSVDWMRMTPFAAPGTYTSPVFDAGSVVQTWQKLLATGSVVSGTTQTLTYRTGNTSIPDATWTPFTATGAGGVITGSSQYIQFKVQQTSTSAAKTPIANDVTVTFKK